MTATTTLVLVVATLLMVVAGTSKKRLEWRPHPIRSWIRRPR